MLEYYWKKFVDAKVAQEYYLAYSVQSGRIEWGLNSLYLLVACSGLAAIFSGVPFLGITVAVSAQCVSALQPILPFGNRKETAGYVYQEDTGLVNQAEHTLYQVIGGKQPEDSLLAELDSVGDGMASIEENILPQAFSPGTIACTGERKGQPCNTSTCISERRAERWMRSNPPAASTAAIKPPVPKIKKPPQEKKK